MKRANSANSRLRRLGIECAIWILMLAGSGCATTGANDCDWYEPIRLSPETIDALPDEAVTAILERNETYRDVCE